MAATQKIIVWARALVVCLAVSPLVGCSGGASGSPTSPPGANPTTKDEAPPVLSVVFVPTDQAVAFFVFGAALPSGVQNPTYEVETLDQTAIVSASSAGKVVNISTSQNGVDQSITLVPSDTSVWSIIYDHVSNVRVSVGQTVSAGTQLGRVGILNNGRGRTELQVNRFDPAPTISHCPQTFGTSAFNTAMTTLAQRLNGSSTVCTTATVRP